MWQRAVRAGATLPGAGSQATAGVLKLLAFGLVAAFNDPLFADRLRVALLPG
jgi:hypothetical protein